MLEEHTTLLGHRDIFLTLVGQIQNEFTKGVLTVCIDTTENNFRITLSQFVQALLEGKYLV